MKTRTVKTHYCQNAGIAIFAAVCAIVLLAVRPASAQQLSAPPGEVFRTAVQPDLRSVTAELWNSQDEAPANLGSDQPSFENRQYCSSSGGLDYLVIGRGGGSYYDVPGESLFGGAYGLDLALHLKGDWGFVGSVNANHISGGAQLVGSTGLVKLPNFNYCDWSSPISFSIFFDQFTDSRVDNLNLHQLRFQLGYALSECFELGALYSEPTNHNTVAIFMPFFGTTTPGAVRQARSAFGYLAGRRGLLQWTVQAGFRDDPDTLALAASLERPFSDRVSVFTTFVSEADRGAWGAALGLEFYFGRRGCASCCDSYSCGASTVAADALSVVAKPASYRVVRAQQPDDDQKLEFNDPDDPSYPLDFFNPVPLSSLWSDDYAAALSRPLMRWQPHQQFGGIHGAAQNPAFNEFRQLLGGTKNIVRQGF